MVKNHPFFIFKHELIFFSATVIVEAEFWFVFLDEKTLKNISFSYF